MATFTSPGHALYFVAGPGPGGARYETTFSTSDGEQTLDDTELDGTFEVGDFVDSGSFAGNFQGTLDVELNSGGAVTCVVLEDIFGTVRVYIPSGHTTSDFNWPSSFQSSDLDTSKFTTCFHAGSLIAIPDGERAVEDLAIGDDILTLDGRRVAVKWIGRQTVLTAFGPAERLMPVRFAAGSLGNGLPHEPLTVTADHGMLIDGVICHAGALVNGETITNVPLSAFGQSYTVYHVEIEAHEIILANGAAAETFIDSVSRRVFDNYHEFEALYGDVPEIEELDYPRAMSARQVPPRIKAKLSPKPVAA